LVTSLPEKGIWPCLFTASDTTGEKDFEEFFTENEVLDLERFQSLGIIKNESIYDPGLLDYFSDTIKTMKENGRWEKEELVDLFHKMIPDFGHLETGKYLDGKM
jgi:hypothetical protein